MPTPSFLEDDISQLPALHLLIQMGFQYLTPEQALAARGGRTANVLLETILKEQLRNQNRINYKGREYEFSEANLNTTVLQLRDLPLNEGYMAANKAYYDLITLGTSLEQTIDGDKKSFSLQYIDWKNPGNNVYHVTEEFSVLRSERDDHYRPDIILFVNGIPMVVIECKSPRIKDPMDEAIRQHNRNQADDGIRPLYMYSNLLLSLSTHEALYGTTATAREFWGVWKERLDTEAEKQQYLVGLYALKNRPLLPEANRQLFGDRFAYIQHQFDQWLANGVTVTEQDKLLYDLCRPERMLDLFFNFIVYDDGVKKITRYQQYFAIHKTLAQITTFSPSGARNGGVIWHTQGSGKSLTMVMLAQLIATRIRNPKIILVTDRIDLDDQITETFQKCKKEVVQATTGASEAIRKKLSGQSDDTIDQSSKRDTSLLGLLHEKSDDIITTLIHKFEAALKSSSAPFSSADIFILVDEGHRSQSNTFHTNMRRLFPNACFIAFTGTPLMKKEKSTAVKFGGIIDDYTITRAVEDKAVVPLLYEGRHHLMSTNEKPLDTYFEKIAEPLTDYGKADLKRKYSSKSILNKADQVVYARAWDIVEHYVDNFQGTSLKGQLVAPNKLTAIKYKEYIDEIGSGDPTKKVTCEVVISPPDEREGSDDVYSKPNDKVLAFWHSLMDKYNKKPSVYEKSIINAFKKQDTPELLIVVDKLLTGFDAPRNTVLYLTRQLREHTLLQAIARVNRLYPGKDYGFIIDYYGNLGNLDSALNTYSEAGLDEFDEDDLALILVNLSEEVKKLPQAHSELWDIFKGIKNKYDEAAYEELLFDEERRHLFYEKTTAFVKILKIALASVDFQTNTPEKQIDKYKQDARFFLALRVSVKRRYFDEANYKAFEPQIQKLIDKHITTDGEALRITELVNLFDAEQRQAEVEKVTGKAAKADHIASRTMKAISVRMNEDPVFYKKLAALIKETIEAYHQQRIDEAEFLRRARDLEETTHSGKRNDLPASLQNNEVAQAYYGLTQSVLEQVITDKAALANLALGIDTAIRLIVFDGNKPRIDWQSNLDIEGKIKIAIDDFLFDEKDAHDLPITSTQIDELIEECLKIAKVRYR
ncbi:type I restriction endonuclease subunit R [Spirosoma litoris]